ncbi:MAG: MazG-like family protein [Candidatus Berkelbacteria bacterium]|nr:MazG-like family protein [Candidatus Berkelbacteria bacterium]
MSLEEVKKRGVNLVKRFEKSEPRRWSIEGSVMELSTEVGDLADLVLRKEYYKKNIYDDLDYQIQDEIADILLVACRIADYYNINLDKAFSEMEKVVDDRLKSRGL